MGLLGRMKFLTYASCKDAATLRQAPDFGFGDALTTAAINFGLNAAFCRIASFGSPCLIGSPFR